MHSVLRLTGLAAVFGAVQALVEAGVFAVLYRDLLLPPYRFFTMQHYDGFTKLYFLLSERFALPDLLTDFLGQGMLAKLVLAPELLIINVIVAVAVAVVSWPVAGILYSGVADRRSRFSWGALGYLLLLLLGVHVSIWVSTTKIPMEPTAGKILRNLGRTALYDGVGLAVVIMLVAALLTSLILRRGRESSIVVMGALVATCMGLSSLSAVWGPPAWARPGTAASVNAEAPAEGQSVIMISIDSLRADHLGAYGYERATSPYIDTLAREGVLFKNCSSTSSWTLPAHISMMTGRSLLGHGVVGDDRSLTEDVPTIAEQFSAAGYTTHAIVSAPYVNSRYGFARGFDDYDDRTVYFETNEDSYKSITVDKVIDAATGFLEANKDRRFFLFLHFWDVHYDFAPRAPYDTMFDPDYDGDVTGEDFYFSDEIHPGMDRRDLDHVIALYDGEIRMVDDKLAELGGVLERLGIADDTVWAVTSDHGDEFFEHGTKGHHRTLYQEVIGVPWVLYAPGLEPKHPVVETEASIIDLMPTLLGVTGLEIPPGVEGQDFSGVYGGEIPEGGTATYAELYRKGSLIVQTSATKDRRKVIHHHNHRILEAYDLAADPGEQRALPRRGVVGAPISDVLLAWLNHVWPIFDERVRRGGVAPVVIDAATEDQLRALGYME